MSGKVYSHDDVKRKMMFEKRKNCEMKGWKVQLLLLLHQTSRSSFILLLLFPRFPSFSHEREVSFSFFLCWSRAIKPKSRREKKEKKRVKEERNEKLLLSSHFSSLHFFPSSLVTSCYFLTQPPTNILFLVVTFLHFWFSIHYRDQCKI